MNLLTNVDNVVNEFSLLISTNDLHFAFKSANVVSELGYQIKTKITNSVDFLKCILLDSLGFVLKGIDSSVDFRCQIKFSIYLFQYFLLYSTRIKNKLKRQHSTIRYLVQSVNKFSLRIAISYVYLKRSK